MSLYVIVNDPSSDPHASTDVKVRIYDSDILPVFNSLETLQEFVAFQHSADEPIQPTPFEIDAFELAVKVEMLGATAGLKFLIFDPVAAFEGRWVGPEKPISVNFYCRDMLEAVRGVKRLFAEGEAKLGDRASTPEGREELLVWCVLQAEKIADDARARAEEWENQDDAWYREPRCLG